MRENTYQVLMILISVINFIWTKKKKLSLFLFVSKENTLRFYFSRRLEKLKIGKHYF